MNNKISAGSKLKLLNVARQSLNNFLKNGDQIQFPTDTLELKEKRAVFVTLRKSSNRNLLGCTGQSKPQYPLIEAVAKTVISSAVNDSRFPSLKINELQDVLIEINVLSNLALSKPENVEIGKHGLVIKKGKQRALFLPQVAISNGWDLRIFFEELCLKADLPKGYWLDSKAKIYVFESEFWGEHEFSN
jgi:uncharacterized protein, PH0010 family